MNALPFGYETTLGKIENPIKIQIQINEKTTEKLVRTRVFKGFDDFETITKFVNKYNEYSINEVTRCCTDSYQRIFFDIDAKYSDYPNVTPETITKAYNVLLTSISNTLTECNIPADVFKLTGHTTEKFSVHLVYKYAYIHAEHYKCLYDSIIENFTFDLVCENLPLELTNIIDHKVYEKNHCLRVHTSHKYGKPTKLRLEGNENSKFTAETLIGYVYPAVLNAPVKTYKCTGSCIKKHIKPTGHLEDVNEALTTSAEAEINKLRAYGIEVRNIKGNFINLIVDHSKPCYVCGNKHENENLFAVVSEKDVKLICRRQPISSLLRAKIIYTFNKYEKYLPTPVAANINTKSDYLADIAETVRDFTKLYLKSELGSGKSTQIYKLILNAIKRKPNFSCIIITYRVNLATAIYKLLNGEKTDDDNIFEKYNDVKAHKISISQHNRMIVQLESLNRIDYDIDGKIDMVIIDEAVSFAQQNLSGLNKHNTGLNRVILKNLLRNCSQCIITDALIDEPTIQAYEVLAPSANKVVWINEPVTQWNPLIMIHKSYAKFRQNIADYLKSGKRAYVSVTGGEKLVMALKEYLSRKTKKNILGIHGNDDNSQIIANINTELVKYDCVIASPCMSAGISFDVKDHFDRIYSFIDSYGPTAVDVIQSLRRVRHPSTKEIVLCDATRKLNLPTTIEDIFADEQLRLKFNSKDYINEGFTLDLNGKNMYFENPNSPLLQWVIHCKRIVNMNRINIFETVLKYLTDRGGVINEVTERDKVVSEVDKKDNEVYNDIKKNVKQTTIDKIAYAPHLTYDEYEKLTKNRVRISAKDRPAIDKYNLLKTYGFEHNLVEGVERIKAKEARMKLFDNPVFVEKYSDPKVLRAYSKTPYRNLSDDTMGRIREEQMHCLSDDDKTELDDMFGRHVTINKILSVFNGNELAADDILPMMKELHKGGNMLIKNWEHPNNKNIKNMLDHILQPYCYTINTRRVIINKKRTKVLFIKDLASELFDIKTINYPTDDFTISVIKQLSNSLKPTIVIYTE
jgi:hypothetical protein